MTPVVAVDIGGTHARFALAHVAGGCVVDIQHETVMNAREHVTLQTAWEAFGTSIGTPLPRAAAIAVACPVDGPVLKLTNNPWTIQPALLGEQLAVDRFSLCNDFTAVGHAVAQLDGAHLMRLCGPDIPLPETGTISIVGPGTGLGVALLVREAGDYRVIATEGGHVELAPGDEIEDLILKRLRTQFRRVSVERVLSGSGLSRIHGVLAEIEGRAVAPMDDRTLWALALSGSDSLARAALDRFGQMLGGAAGDFALGHGSGGVVIAGGLGRRVGPHLPSTGFEQRFVAKGRFETRMAALPVKLLTYPEPGLYGAAAAFAAQYRD